MAKYEDILKEIQGKTYTDVSNRQISAPIKKKKNKNGFEVAEIPTGVTASSPLIPTANDISNSILGVRNTSVQPTVTLDTSIQPTTTSNANKDGYYYFGKTVGDYDYHNFTTIGNYKVYKKDDNYYYYDENNKKYKQLNMNTLYGDESKYDNDYEQAIKSGKKYDYSKISMQDKLKLDSSDLTKKQYEEYEKDLARGNEKAYKEYERKYAMQDDTPGIRRVVQTGKNLVGTVNKQLVEPVSNVGELYEAGKKQNDLSLEYYKQMVGKENKAEKMQEEYNKYAEFNQDLINDKTWGGTAIKNANVQVESLKNQGIAATILGIAGAGIGAGVGAITGVGVGTGAATGAKAGGQIGYIFGSTPYTYKLEAGSEYKELIDLGVDEDIARKYSKTVGAINAVIESGENIIDLVTFGKAGKITENATNDMINDIVSDIGETKTKKWLASKFGEKQANKIISIAAKTGASYLQNIASEGLEEGSQELTSIIGERLATKESGIERNVSWSEDFERILDSTIAGAISTALTAPISSLGGAIVTNTVNNIQTKIDSKVVKNNIVNQTVNQAEKQLGRKLNNNEKNAIVEKVNEAYAQQENIRNENIKEISKENKSSEGLDLVESYKAYNGDTKYTNQIENMQKFMNNRNINARFDATMFNNSKQNAIWTTLDGIETVVFNPKAAQDQIIQNIATHEMAHDIFNQKTEMGTSLFNDVLENIKSQENYAQLRQETENTYARYYDKNSKEFAVKVDEEMVANELGKNLGTQEYINRLVNEKPNLAKRIYNWVVDKLDNIGKSEEYKEQKAYWKSVADKFEKAYNEQKTATGEDKTAYDISYRGSHQIENAKSITELNLDDVRNKITEIDGYLTNQSQSDLKKLQKILNNPSEKVKIYRASPLNELNNGDWVTTDRSYAQNVADNNGGKVYSYEVDANQLLYPDNVRELPSLHRLSSFQYNGENINQTKYSMQQEETPFTEGTRTTMGELFNENITPIKEDISKISEQMYSLSNQIETLQEGLENTSKSKGYVEEFKENIYDKQKYNALTKEEADLYQNALMNDEGYLKSLDEQASANENNTKLVNKVSNDIQDTLGLGKKQKETLRGIINDAIENDYSVDEISNKLQEEFSRQTYAIPNEEVKNIKKLIKETPIKVSDGIKKDIADYGNFQKNNFNKIIFSRNGTPVDVAYQMLSEQAPSYFPSDIINPTDQLLKISEVANMMNEISETVDIPSDTFDNMADYIRNSIIDDKYNSQVRSDASLSNDIQFNFIDEVAPTTIRSQESIDEFKNQRDISPVRSDNKAKTELKEKFNATKVKAQEMFINRNQQIDNLAKATGNEDIKFAGDMLNNVASEAQYNINNAQTNANGIRIGKSVKEIFTPAREAGLYEAFNDYLIQKSNIERHAVGKGSEVPLIVSQQLVEQYEQENPQFKTWAKDVYKYFDNVLKEQVDAGLITEDKYNDYRGENGIYRSYVPFYSENIDRSRYFDENNELRAVTTLKKSKGNAKDTGAILAVEDAMAKQTYAYKNAIRTNELYKQIVSTQEKFDAMLTDDLRSNPSDLTDSLMIDEDGNAILTAYYNGEKVSSKISEELYNELSRTNENRIKQLEEDFSLLTKPIQKLSDIRRKLITSWNPIFLVRNAIKDIQDAAINSKHSKDMLKNYFNGKNASIIELAQAKTTEAQQFLALYGADNTYGDYAGKTKNKLSKLNELIELAPRFAEFKASLQNGESVQQAIYNAREVTTNFGRGGYVTKALNRNGFTFLNASVQGLDKMIRNVTGQNGIKGYTQVVTKGVMLAVAPAILNHLMFGWGDDKDEDYEALPDYIKDNYYLIKLEDGTFIRIPKGRITAVIGSAARRTLETIETGENQYKGWGSNAWSQVGVGDLGNNNLLAPIKQVATNKAWHGGDIVPTRLQKLPSGEQSDEKTDAISKFIGETLGVSPKKINYLIDQYSGAAGDVLLPMLTPASNNGASNPIEYALAPVADAFVVNSTDDNKYAGEFYETKDKLEINKNSFKATDEDVLKYKYMSSISSQLSELYKERREIQSDTRLSKKEKYKKVQKVQEQINSLAKEALSNYKDINKTDTYANINDVEYYKDNDGEWNKANESDIEFTSGLNTSEKTSYYKTKNKISSANKLYKEQTNGLDDEKLKSKYASEKKENITKAIINSGLDDYTKAMIYSKSYASRETMTNAVNAGYDIDTYITALYDMEELRDKYSKNNGYSTEQRKMKLISYVNSLNMDIPLKAMLIRNYYTSFKQYNNDIVNYVSNLDISYEDKIEILKGTGMKVNRDRVSW